MRICSACGRPIEHHEVVGTRTVLFERGTVPGHRDRVYRCDVVAITNDTAFDFLADDWVPGERRVPDSLQRTARNPARFITKDSLAAIKGREL